MTTDNDGIIAEFVIESREHLADIENQLLAIEAGGANIDVELVNKTFRAVHSIKGAAGFFGFTTLGQLAHNLENVFNLIRNRQFVPDAEASTRKGANFACRLWFQVDRCKMRRASRRVFRLPHQFPALCGWFHEGQP